MDNDAERKSMMSRPMPARPKGATAPLDFHRQFMQEKIADETVQEPDPFVIFTEILRMLKKLPKAQRRSMVALIAELLTE